MNLYVVVHFLSVWDETAVNINRIMHERYAKNRLPNDSTICQWRREFLAGLFIIGRREKKRVSFCGKLATFYALGIEKLVQRYNICFDHLGDYVEK